MVGNFKMKSLNTFVKSMVSTIIFLHQEPHKKNGVVQRKNRSLEELARTMLNENSLPKYCWTDAINTACYVLNRVLIRSILKKTPYELFKGRRPVLSHLKVFGCKFFILNNGKESLGKFDAKVDEGVFLGYATQSHADIAVVRRSNYHYFSNFSIAS